MKILVYGAGVLGSLFAARLQAADNDVTVLARGQRLVDIQRYGILLENVNTHKQTATPVNVIEHLDPQDAYDLALVLVRKDQLSSVLPELAANQKIPSVVFMMNNAVGPQEIVAALGKERVLLGFPGAGGERDGRIVRYSLAKDEAVTTTIGELDGAFTHRLFVIGKTFQKAGFSVEYCTNMDAWLKTHAAIVCPIANALYLADGDNYRLARTRDGVILMLRSMREGLRVLKALDIPILPTRLRVIEWVPEPLLVGFLQLMMGTRRAELLMARHANVARDEMILLSQELKQLAQESGVPTPNTAKLEEYQEQSYPRMVDGASGLMMDYRQVSIGMFVLASLVLINWSRRRSR